MHRLAFVSLWIFVFCVPWENATKFSAVGTVGRAAGLVAGLVCVVAIALSARIRINAFAITALLFFIYASLSILWSPYPDVAFEAIKTGFQLAIMVLLVHQFANNSIHVRNFFIAFVLGSLVTALSTIHAFETAPEIDITYRRFAASGSFNENEIAITMAIAIAMAWHIALTANAWFYRCIVVFIPVGSVASMLTGSRSGFVATMIALSTPLFRISGMSSRGKALVMLGVMPLMAIGLVGISGSIVPEDTLARIGTLAEGRARDDEGGLGGRITIWMTGLEMFAHSNPVIGTGARTFAAHMTAVYGTGDSAHNAFIATAVELGLIGLFLFLLLLSRLAHDVMAAPASDRPTWYVLMAVLLIDFMLNTPVWYKAPWLLWALATGYAYRYSAERHSIKDFGRKNTFPDRVAIS